MRSFACQHRIEMPGSVGLCWFMPVLADAQCRDFVNKQESQLCNKTVATALGVYVCLQDPDWPRRCPRHHPHLLSKIASLNKPTRLYMGKGPKQLFDIDSTIQLSSIPRIKDWNQWWHGCVCPASAYCSSSRASQWKRWFLQHRPARVLCCVARALNSFVQRIMFEAA